MLQEIAIDIPPESVIFLLIFSKTVPVVELAAGVASVLPKIFKICLQLFQQKPS